jgi:hypothetical protein
MFKNPTLADINEVYDESKRGLSSEKPFSYSFQKLLSFRIFFES